MPTIRLPYNYQPRSYQRRIYAAWQRGVRRFLLVMHRRSGKTKTLINLMPLAMQREVGNYAHVFPTLKQAKDVVWRGLDHTGFPYLGHFPAALLGNDPNTSEARVTWYNGSTYTLYGTDRNVDALVGGNVRGVLWDEWSLQNPLARDYTRPILTENGGWEAICLTPRGENHAYDLYEAVKHDPAWHVEYLTVQDTRRDAPGESGAPVITQAAIEAERRELQARGEQNAEAIIQQEYYLSWQAPMPGAYYAQQMLEAKQQGRITSILWDPQRPVATYWDMGTSKAHDTNTIWFVQQQGNAVLLIEYYEAANYGMEHYAGVLRERPYQYSGHWAKDGDLDVADWGTGKTRQEIAQNFGITFRGVPEIPLVDGINASRALLPRCVFDAERCRKGLNALRSYKRKWDEVKRTFADHPEHDWASHGADSFRYLAIGISEQLDTRRERVSRARLAFSPWDVGQERPRARMEGR